MKVCLVSSCGGHLTEVRCLRPAYENYQHFYIINQRIELPEDMQDKTYFISHAERDWKVLLNIWEAWLILRKEKPDIILSTGAGPLVPVAVVGRLCWGSKVIFVECLNRISSPSLTGRLMRFLAHDVFYQWPQLRKFYPRGKYLGQLI